MTNGGNSAAASTSKYWDKRADLFQGYFEKALPYKQYVATGTSQQQEKWQAFHQAIAMNPDVVTTLKSFVRRLNILVMSGIWCGDCARQGPIFAKFEEATPTLHFRFIDNRANPDLQNELRINGAEKVPVVVVLSEDFFELARFGDKHLSVYQRKLKTELGAACDPGLLTGSDSELKTEISEWVAFFERAHALVRLAPMLRNRYSD